MTVTSNFFITFSPTMNPCVQREFSYLPSHTCQNVLKELGWGHKVLLGQITSKGILKSAWNWSLMCGQLNPLLNEITNEKLVFLFLNSQLFITVTDT